MLFPFYPSRITFFCRALVPSFSCHFTLVKKLLTLLIVVFGCASFGEAFPAVANPFITTWRTTQNGESITIPTTGGGYNYSVDWGDGTSEVNKTGNATHLYAVAGSYTVTISGDFPQIYFHNTGDKNKIMSIDQWGGIAWRSMNGAFYGCTNLTLKAVDSPDLSGVTDMGFMFAVASAFHGNLNHWDVSHVTNMEALFINATSFHGDVSSWDVHNVTNMRDMFSSATSFNGDLSGWNVGAVKDMSSMFSYAFVFNQDISGWDVGNVTNMHDMFANAQVFNKDIGGWDVSNVTNMNAMFQNALNFNQDIGGWNVGKVTDMHYMFGAAISFNQNLNNWNVSNVTYMRLMFDNAAKFNGNISSWDVSHVTDMSSMFNTAVSFNTDISGWNVGNVTKMNDMFSQAQSFNQDIGNWNVANVTTMRGMFAGAWIFNIDLRNWNVSHVTDMAYMFSNTQSFIHDLSNWDVSHVKNMSGIFYYAKAFDHDLAAWDVSAVTDMNNIFHNANLSIANYDNTLIGWAGLSSPKNNVPLGATGLYYCKSTAARQHLIDAYGWIITDSGERCPSLMVSGKKDSPTQLTIVFSDNVKTKGGNPTDFTAKDAAGNPYLVTAQRDGTAGDTRIILTVADLSTAVGPLTVTYVNNHNEISDASGKAFVETDLTGVTIDITDPTVTISSDEPFTTNHSPIFITIAFSEDVSEFQLEDILVEGGTIDNLTTMDSIAFTAYLTPLWEGIITVNIPGSVVFDAAGNGNVPAAPFTLLYDSMHPTVVISSVASDPTAATPIPITITFSEEVTGFSMSDCTISGGTLSDFVTADNITFTAMLIPAGEGFITVDIAEAVAHDIASNGNVAAEQFSIEYSVTSPEFPAGLFLPELFSPNEDGSNDRFVVRGSVSIAWVEFSIFDRDNNLVYHTNDWGQLSQHGWDGMRHSQKQPQGTYMWVINGAHTTGESLYVKDRKTGIVRLIR